jgi:hypothetical protein
MLVASKVIRLYRFNRSLCLDVFEYFEFVLILLYDLFPVCVQDDSDWLFEVRVVVGYLGSDDIYVFEEIEKALSSCPLHAVDNVSMESLALGVFLDDVVNFVVAVEDGEEGNLESEDQSLQLLQLLLGQDFLELNKFESDAVRLLSNILLLHEFLYLG